MFSQFEGNVSGKSETEHYDIIHIVCINIISNIALGGGLYYV